MAGAGPGREGPRMGLERWARPDLEETRDFMGHEKASHSSGFHQGREFVFPEDLSGCCVERRLDAGLQWKKGNQLGEFCTVPNSDTGVFKEEFL